MLRLPTRHVTEAARRNLDAFQSTSAAKELADDTCRWDVVEWSWAAGPPMRVTLRSEHGDVVDFEMDETGIWRVFRDPNVPMEPMG
jgi:hypothetical protein